MAPSPKTIRMTPSRTITSQTLETLDPTERRGQKITYFRHVRHFQEDGPAEHKPGERVFSSGPHHSYYSYTVESAMQNNALNPLAFAHSEYELLIAETIEQIHRLSSLKGGEYAGDVDRLANFRRNAKDLELPMETVWRIYCAKHWDAVGQYIRDLQTGKQRTRLESIEGRLDDIIVYCILFKAMVREREREYESTAEGDPRKKS